MHFLMVRATVQMPTMISKLPAATEVIIMTLVLAESSPFAAPLTFTLLVYKSTKMH